MECCGLLPRCVDVRFTHERRLGVTLHENGSVISLDSSASEVHSTFRRDSVTTDASLIER